MIKKIMLGTVMLSPLAMIACSSEQVHAHYPIAHTYRLSDGPEAKSVEKIGDTYTTVNAISSPDSMELPGSVLFSDKSDSQISNYLKLFKNTLNVEYTFNDNFKITSSNPNWVFDGDRLIKHDHSKAVITIKLGSLTATTNAYYGSLDSQLMKNGDLSKVDVTKLVTVPTWGTTTTFSKKTIDSVNTLNVSMVDVKENAGGLKAYGQILHLANLDNPVALTPYANYIAEKVYVTKEMLNTPIWFRSYWKGPDHTNLNDFGTGTFTKEGWYLIQAPINKTLKWNGNYVLDTLKYVQLASNAPAKSGDLYVQGIYESFDKMTSTAGPKAEVING